MSRSRPPSDRSRAAPTAKRQGASAAIVERLRWDILTMRRPPGAHLDEQQLSAEFDVSRTPIREGLKRLAMEELVVLSPRRGATVAPIPLDDVGQFFDALRLVQRSIFMLAATNPDASLLDEARALQKKAEDMAEAGEIETIPQLNMELHLKFAEIVRNRYLTRMYMRLLQDGLRLAWLPLTKGQGQWEAGNFNSDHNDIIAAIAAGDVPRAAVLADRHTDLFERDVIEALLNRGTGEIKDVIRRSTEWLPVRKEIE